MKSPNNNTMIIVVLLVSLASAAFSPGLGFQGCDFPAIFNFGDSNSDTGGGDAAFFPVPPPFGETYFHKPAGRRSDGRLLIDFITQGLELPLLDGYLDAVGTNFSHGVNFAVSAATIEPAKINFLFGGFPFSLDVLVGQFQLFKSRSHFITKQGGVFRDLLPRDEYFPKALYTFDIGENDLIGGFSANLTKDQVIATVPAIINRFVVDVKNVYGLGGRSFWIHNIGPIGCLPYLLIILPKSITQDDQMDGVGCSRPLNEAAQYFNQRLKEAIDQLRKDLPLAAITYVDVYTPKYSLYTQPHKYGFEHPFEACCGFGGGKYNFSPIVQCGSTVTINGTQVSGGSCSNPKARISWEGVHYSEAANKVVFDQIASGKFSDPPLPLNFACHRIK